jgi:RimJ/RimL family protein N-acetyltransferase
MVGLHPFSNNLKQFLAFYFKAREAGVREVWRGSKGDVITLRLTRADDAQGIQALVQGLSLRSRYHRFFYPVQELTPDMVARFTTNAPGVAMNLVAVTGVQGQERLIGMAQYVVEGAAGGPGAAEFAVVVADEWHREGLGRRLVQAVVCLAREAGIDRLEGDVLSENEPMRGLMLNLGFRLMRHQDGAYLRRASKELNVPGWKCSSSTVKDTTMARSTHVAPVEASWVDLMV